MIQRVLTGIVWLPDGNGIAAATVTATPATRDGLCSDGSEMVIGEQTYTVTAGVVDGGQTIVGPCNYRWTVYDAAGVHIGHFFGGVSGDAGPIALQDICGNAVTVTATALTAGDDITLLSSIEADGLYVLAVASQILSLSAYLPDHGTLTGLADDDHSQYVHTAPQAAARNLIVSQQGTEVLGLRAAVDQTEGLLRLENSGLVGTVFAPLSAFCENGYGFTLNAGAFSVKNNLTGFDLMSISSSGYSFKSESNSNLITVSPADSEIFLDAGAAGYVYVTPSLVQLGQNVQMEMGGYNALTATYGVTALYNEGGLAWLHGQCEDNEFQFGVTGVGTHLISSGGEQIFTGAGSVFNATAATIPLISRGAALQTANIFAVQSSVSADYLTVDASGSVVAHGKFQPLGGQPAAGLNTIIGDIDTSAWAPTATRNILIGDGAALNGISPNKVVGIGTDVVVGSSSVAVGENADVLGAVSIGIGRNAQVSGSYAGAFGYAANAPHNYAYSFGRESGSKKVNSANFGSSLYPCLELNFDTGAAGFDLAVDSGAAIGIAADSTVSIYETFLPLGGGPAGQQNLVIGAVDMSGITTGDSNIFIGNGTAPGAVTDVVHIAGDVEVGNPYGHDHPGSGSVGVGSLCGIPGSLQIALGKLSSARSSATAVIVAGYAAFGNNNHSHASTFGRQSSTWKANSANFGATAYPCDGISFGTGYDPFEFAVDQVIVAEFNSTSGTDGVSNFGINLTAGHTITLNDIGPIFGHIAAPATAASTGVAGEIRADASYIYRCTAANTWTRAAAAFATW